MQVRRRITGEDDGRLRDAFETVLAEEVVPAYYPQGSAIGEARGLADIETVLRVNVAGFSERYEPRGLERCLEAIRDIHGRTAKGCFGGEDAERLAALLRSVRDLGFLGEVADIMIRPQTGDEILLQVRGLLEAGPGNGNGDLRP